MSRRSIRKRRHRLARVNGPIEIRIGDAVILVEGSASYEDARARAHHAYGAVRKHHQASIDNAFEIMKQAAAVARGAAS